MGETILHIFRKGDRVKVTRRGAIDWEEKDWSYELKSDLVYTVKETDLFDKQPSIKVEDYEVHPNHFSLVKEGDVK